MQQYIVLNNLSTELGHYADKWYAVDLIDFFMLMGSYELIQI
jgi:hypothetical protein